MTFETWRKKTLSDLEILVCRLTADNAKDVARWCGGDLVEEINPFDHENKIPGINVPTDQGRERASLGDYVFDLSVGSFRVSKPNAFRNVWEPADEKENR